MRDILYLYESSAEVCGLMRALIDKDSNTSLNILQDLVNLYSYNLQYDFLYALFYFQDTQNKNIMNLLADVGGKFSEFGERYDEILTQHALYEIRFASNFTYKIGSFVQNADEQIVQYIARYIFEADEKRVAVALLICQVMCDKYAKKSKKMHSKCT